MPRKELNDVQCTAWMPRKEFNDVQCTAWMLRKELNDVKCLQIIILNSWEPLYPTEDTSQPFQLTSRSRNQGCGSGWSWPESGSDPREKTPDLPSRKTRYRSYPKITTQIQDNNMHKYFFYDKLSYQSQYNCDIINFLEKWIWSDQSSRIRNEPDPQPPGLNALTHINVLYRLSEK